MATAILRQGSPREAHCRHGRRHHDSEAVPVLAATRNAQSGSGQTEGLYQPPPGQSLGGSVNRSIVSVRKTDPELIPLAACPV
eukprot:7034261-Alexandrium_andersonii.AAC.1